MRWSEEQLEQYRANRAGAAIKKVALAGQSAPKVETSKPVIRQSRREPNKTERRFEVERLRMWHRIGWVVKYDYEAVTLKIANGCRYTPDWWAITNEGRTQFYEIKARKMIWDDAIVKLKVAAAQYTAYEFWLCAWDKNGWTVERVLP